MTFDPVAPVTSPARWDDDRLLADLPELRIPDGDVLVVAAHPDDETLGAGGLLATLADRGRAVRVVIASDGAGSHPGSPTLTGDQLVDVRRREVVRALAHLCPDADLVLLDLPDGALAERREVLAARLADLTRADDLALVVAPWRRDGHPDHDATGEVCAALADARGAVLAEYPIWAWHWARPGDPRVPWDRMASLGLSAQASAAKLAALASYESQVAPLSEHPADAAVVGPDLVRLAGRDEEPYLVDDAAAAGSLRADYFAPVYDASDDPWGFTDRWYEERKRALTLAALPERRYAHGWEVGSSIGVLTRELAQRCDRLDAIDLSPAAVAAARERLEGQAHVHLAVGDLAADAPPDGVDLVVLSEVGYYLGRADLRAALDRVVHALHGGGTVVACHWRHPVADYPLSGDEVHRILATVAAGRLHRIVQHREDDLLLEVYAHDPRSVAARTGLVG